jgi:hypothetical protein
MLKIIKLMIKRIKKTPANEIMEFCYDNELALMSEIIVFTLVSILINIIVCSDLAVNTLIPIAITMIIVVANYMQIGFVTKNHNYQIRKLEAIKKAEEEEKEFNDLRNDCYRLITNIETQTRVNHNYDLKYILGLKDLIGQTTNLVSMRSYHKSLVSEFKHQREIEELRQIKEACSSNIDFFEKLCKTNNVFSIEASDFLRDANDYYKKYIYNLPKLRELLSSLNDGIEWAKNRIAQKLNEEEEAKKYRQQQQRQQQQRQHSYSYRQYSEPVDEYSTYMAILGLDPHIKDLNIIKKKWHELMIQYHPDKHPGDKNAEEMSKKINEAYVYVKDALE